MTALYIILAIVAVIALWLVAVYNGLITLRNRTKESWSDIDVQLKRRYDLIPNLVETVKGYLQHEAATLEKVTAARTAAMSAHDGAKSLAEKAQAENALSATLKSLFAVAESYPDLKASANFLQLQGELTDTENKIEAARRFYNGNVRDFNTKMEVFPNNLIAGWLKFVKFEFFEAAGAEKEAVVVKF